MDDYHTQQQEEIEALHSIFDSEITVITAHPLCFMIELADLDVQLRGKVVVKFTFPENYPDEVPIIEIPSRSEILNQTQQQHLWEHLSESANQCTGMPMVFTLVDDAKTWINENVGEQLSEDTNSNDNLSEEEDITDANVVMSEPKVSGGRWDFVIGLVGKPSAGKSTFFNAATQQNRAKTASHPFTTIEPNISKGFYTIPCPCSKLEFTCDTEYGHSFNGERYIPVLLKDVAGLVPGACQGKGRGNRFLNDLLDADVLLHIVDISGCTDETGEQTSGYDPLLDVAWLQQEIHQWIYDNVMDKWDGIKKKPLKLIEMFTGYHATKSVIYTAFQNAGIDDKELSKLASWDEKVLHRIVDHFLRIRFPIYLVLNKCDSDTAEENIVRLKEKYPEAPSLPVSAKTECDLQDFNKANEIEYQCGSPVIIHTDIKSAKTSESLAKIQADVLDRYGSTNVLRALSEAVRLRHPGYVYPVQDLDTLRSIDKYRGIDPGKLRDCVCLKPHTTVEEAYTAMLHYPVQLLAGDFIRAEAYHNGSKKIVRKDDIISEENCIIKIMTNKTIHKNKIKPKTSPGTQSADG